MTADVVEFKRPQKTEPHLAGMAHCFGCGHKWAGVAPLKTLMFECPQCHANKGVFTNHVEMESGHIWVCGCGCKFFSFYLDAGAKCINCGDWQRFP